MKEIKTISAGFMESIVSYWNHFVHALPRITIALLIFFIVFFIALYFSRLIKTKFSRAGSDPLFVRFLSKITRVAVIIVGLILALQTMGLSGVAGGLLAGAGISAFVFGFAFKDIAENFLAGLILAFNRPFAMNDTIIIDNFSGHVIALNFRTTLIKTFDERDVFIPNAIIIKQPLTNLTRDGKLRMDFVVGIAYENDINKAISLILEAMAGMDFLKREESPFAVVEELAASTVNIRVFFWANTFDYKKGVLQMKSDVITNVKSVLEKEGFSLPANITEIKPYQPAQPFRFNVEGPQSIRT